MTRGSTLQVQSARGIGSFELPRGAQLPARICFSYDSQRRFDRLEGLELVRIEDGTREYLVTVVIEDACARACGPPVPGRYRVRFVDYYR
ncbi:MAG: hypothetical protein IT530_02125 [Burkholderiales bacterium]|nr:hypothetical protein [Burkholderiales bacterium]